MQINSVGNPFVRRILFRPGVLYRFKFILLIFRCYCKVEHYSKLRFRVEKYIFMVFLQFMFECPCLNLSSLTSIRDRSKICNFSTLELWKYLFYSYRNVYTKQVHKVASKCDKIN